MLQFKLLCRFHQNMKANRDNNKCGFTLIELLLSLAISSIIVVTLYSILKFTITACKIGDMEDEILLNGKYAIEYIKKEIQTADAIIAIDKFEGLRDEYEKNIGFVILHYFPKDNLKYNYSTYYHKDNGIYRIGTNVDSELYPKASSFTKGGHNKVADYVVSIDGTGIDFEANIIELCFTLQESRGRSTIFKTKSIIRCPAIY